MKWGTRYAHYTTIKRAIILYYVHYIAIIRLWMKWIICTTITIIYDFSYYAHYVAIIYIMHIISLLYGCVGNVLFVLFMRSPRVAASSCWRRMLVDMSARPRPNIYIHIYNLGHGSPVLVTAVVLRQQALEPLREGGGGRERDSMTALESQWYSCTGLRTFPSSNTSLHTVAGERVTDNRRW
jgi:hypothetical protein